MELNLENLSVEDLKTLYKNIDLLLKDKCKPKYKPNDYLIDPDDFFFIQVVKTYDNDINNTCYRINVNDSNGHDYLRYVNEPYMDKCLIISKEIYDSLLNYKNELRDKLVNFKNKQFDEISNYRKLLSNEFKNKLQEVINGLNKS